MFFTSKVDEESLGGSEVAEVEERGRDSFCRIKTT